MRKGFTLIELMIVIAIIAIIAAIAIPNLLDSKISGNESAASNSMKTIHGGQETYKSQKYNNVNADQEGEYGHLGQLCGAVAAWGTTGANGLAAGEIGIISDDFTTDDPARLVSADITSDFSGYIFSSYLDADSAAGSVNADNAERYYAIVAVPDAFGDTGRNAFVMNQRGEVMSSPAATDAYEGDTDTVLTTSTYACYDAIASAVQADNDRSTVKYW